MKIGQVFKEEILDEQEKEYLNAVIKPFRKRVKYVEKKVFRDQEYIMIELDDECFGFPYFERGSMYKGMEVDKEYSLEELGL